MNSNDNHHIEWISSEHGFKDRPISMYTGNILSGFEVPDTILSM